MRSAETITTERLVLEPLHVGHAHEMVAILAEPRLYEFIGGKPPSYEDLQDQYRSLEDGQSADGREIWLNWIVRRRSDQQAVGTVQATITDGDTTPAAHVAWVVGSKWQRNGFASEAVLAMVQWLELVGVSVISACIHPDHHASERVAARVGLVATLGEKEGERLWRKTPSRNDENVR